MAAIPVDAPGTVAAFKEYAKKVSAKSTLSITSISGCCGARVLYGFSSSINTFKYAMSNYNLKQFEQKFTEKTQAEIFAVFMELTIRRYILEGFCTLIATTRDEEKVSSYWAGVNKALKRVGFVKASSRPNFGRGMIGTWVYKNAIQPKEKASK